MKGQGDAENPASLSKVRADATNGLGMNGDSTRTSKMRALSWALFIACIHVVIAAIYLPADELGPIVVVLMDFPAYLLTGLMGVNEPTRLWIAAIVSTVLYAWLTYVMIRRPWLPS